MRDFFCLVSSAALRMKAALLPFNMRSTRVFCLPSSPLSARGVCPRTLPPCPLACRLGGVSLPRFRSGYTHALPLVAKRAFPRMVSQNSRKNKKAGQRLTDLDNKREVVSLFSLIFGIGFHIFCSFLMDIFLYILYISFF